MRAGARVPVVVGCVLIAAFAGAAHAAGGNLDPTFSHDGKVTTAFAGGAGAWSVAIQPDGMIVVAGGAVGKFGLARYDKDGGLDTTFGGNGKVTTDLTGGEDVARGVAVQADGKIVAVGHANFRRFAIVRYNPNGTLDTTFGGDGVVLTNFTPGSDIAYGVAIQRTERSLSRALRVRTSGRPSRWLATRRTEGSTRRSAATARSRPGSAT